MEDELIEKKAKEYAKLLETYRYSDLKNLLKGWEKSNSKEFFLFQALFHSSDIFQAISYHKILLAKILAESSKVEALPEDRSRIVFLLADYTNASFEQVNQAFVKEFGPYFKIFRNYNIGTAVKPWSDLAKRASEIRNGYMNHNYITVQGAVDDIIAFTKDFPITDYNILKQMDNLAGEILVQVGDQPEIPLATPAAAKIKEKVHQLYKMAGVLEMEIVKMEQSEDFETVADFVLKIKYACLLKTFCLEKNIDIKTYPLLEGFLLTEIGNMVGVSYLNEGIKRNGVKLRPMIAKLQAASNLQPTQQTSK
jgi:hypothetical protein